jgi:integrase
MLRSLGSLLDCAGLTHMRLHDLRHTATTLQLSTGTHPKAVADMLADAGVAVSLSTATPCLSKPAAPTNFEPLLRG